MTTVVLHGYLKDLYPHPIEMIGHSVAEVLNGVCRQIKEFRPMIGKGRHCVRVAGYNSVEEILGPIKTDVIHVVPDFTAAKEGFLQIVIGTIIVAAAIWASGGIGGVAAATMFWGTVSASTVLFFGATMILGGLIMMLSPAPTTDTRGSQDPEASRYLGNPANTVKAGTRIPILYGIDRVYGHYLSYNVDAVDVASEE